VKDGGYVAASWHAGSAGGYQLRRLARSCSDHGTRNAIGRFAGFEIGLESIELAAVTLVGSPSGFAGGFGSNSHERT